MARIYKQRFYVRETIPGISGFQRWGDREYSVVTGHKAANCRLEIVGELLPISEDYWRIGDGHVPECQPLLRTPEAIAWLRKNPYGEIVRLDPGTRTKDVKPHYA